MRALRLHFDESFTEDGPVTKEGPAIWLDSELCLLRYWITERETIRISKEGGLPKPWTADTYLRDYRWCNVSRMDDRVSVELMRDWYCDADVKTQLIGAALGRLINWPATLLDATGGKPFTSNLLPAIRPALHARAARGEKVFTGAYVIPGVPGRNKIDSVMDLVERVADAVTWLYRPTLRETWSALVTLDGLGSFLAGQITADVAQLAAGSLWSDRLSWAPVGPGSARGINRLRGREKNRSVTQTQFDRELAEYVELMRPLIRDIHVDRRLGAQDYQGTLCEFDKYRRLQLQEGKVRARYDGGSVSTDLSPQQNLFA